MKLFSECIIILVVNRFILIFIGLVAVLVAAIMLLHNPGSEGGALSEDVDLPDYPRIEATIGSEKFTPLQTRDIKENRLGLGAVPVLPKNYGMTISGKDRIGVWMKGMKYPIDIIWIDKDGRVIHIVHDAQPSSYPKTTYYNPIGTYADLVVEIGAGEAKRLNLENGAKISLKQVENNSKNDTIN